MQLAVVPGDAQAAFLGNVPGSATQAVEPVPAGSISAITIPTQTLPAVVPLPPQTPLPVPNHPAGQQMSLYNRVHAASKVPGIRAALCHDAETARGARIWNHANVLALSLRATSIPVAKEILDAWFATRSDEGEAQSEWNRQQIDRVKQIEEKHRK